MLDKVSNPPEVHEERRPRDSAAVEPLGPPRLHDLLVVTSRTFALCVPELPAPTAREVTTAYLLFRIADTLEDATMRWGRSRRLAALRDFAELIERPSVARCRELASAWSDDPPTTHRGYLELMRQAPAVVATLLDLSPEATASIARHTGRTARRMAGFVERAGAAGKLRLADLADLRAYCYAVAGIVGELLTDLFVLRRPRLAALTPELAARAPLFGEGLQLVNILKDAAADTAEGRDFLPRDVDRRRIFALARADLGSAAEYCLMIQRHGGPSGIVAFTALPIELAWATLDRVERHGPGSKISRREVFLIHRRTRRAIAAGRPAVSRPIN